MGSTIQIQINGQKKRFSSPLSLKSLLQEYQIRGKHLAIALNDEIIPHGLWEGQWLQEEDRIEVLRAVAGG